MSELNEDGRKFLTILEGGERRGLLDAKNQAILDRARRDGLIKKNPFTTTDRTPMAFDEVEERKRVTRVQGPNMPAKVNTQLLAERRASAEAGIAEENIGAVSNLKLGLAANPSKEVKKVLDAKFKKDIKVRYDKLTGKYQYINPESNRTVNIGVEGLDSGDVGFALGESPVVIGDVAGTVIGGAVGSRVPAPGATVAGEAIGSGTGVFLGELLRLSTGQLFGVNEDMSLEDMVEHSARKAGIAGMLTAGTGGLMQLGKAIVNFRKGRTGSLEAAYRAGLKEDEAKLVIDKISEMQRKFGPVPEEKMFKSTTAKRSGDETLLGDEATLRREKDHVRNFVERDTTDAKALANAFDAITPSGQGGSKTQAAFQQARNSRLNNATKAVNASKQNLKDELDILSTQGVSTDGEVIRKAIIDKRIAVKDAGDRIHLQWKNLAGANADQTASQVKIPIGQRTRKLLTTLDKESRNAIDNEVKRARKGILTKGFKQSGKDKAVDTGLVDTSGNAITRIVKAKETDLMDYQRSISAMRTLIRQGDKGTSALSGEQLKVVARTLKAVRRDRDIFLAKSGRDDVLFAIKSADTFTAQSKDLLDNSVAGEIMVLRNGRYTVRNQEIFDTGFVKHGKEQSNEIKNVIGGNAESMQEWRNNIVQKYKDIVLTEEGPNLKRHIKFIKEYKEAMEPFFSKPEMARITRLGEVVKVVEQKELQLKNTKRLLNTPISGTGKTQKLLSSMDPEEIAPWLTVKDKGPGRARRLKQLLSHRKEEFTEVQNSVRHNFRREVIDREGNLDSTRFSNHVRKNAETYKVLFGEEYVKDLDVLVKALDISDRAGKTLAERELLGIETQVLRGTLFAPLTKEGRLFTAALKWRSKVGRDAIANALLNPSDLSELAALSQLSATSREAAELMMSLGYIGATTEDLEQ